MRELISFFLPLLHYMCIVDLFLQLLFLVLAAWDATGWVRYPSLRLVGWFLLMEFPVFFVNFFYVPKLTVSELVLWYRNDGLVLRYCFFCCLVINSLEGLVRDLGIVVLVGRDSIYLT